MTQQRRIIDFEQWLSTPLGQYVLLWEQAQLNQVVSDIFGFHAVQLGLPSLNALAQNRMPHRWVALEQEASKNANASAPSDQLDNASWVAPALVADFDALPFATHSMDLVVLPHALELSRDAHQTLREVERVLVPEGHAIIIGFNPASLWGLRRRCSGWRPASGPSVLPPCMHELIGYWRLRDWLKLLNFDIEAGQFACYRPALRSEKWLKRFAWMDKAGDRWWPVFGSVYFLVAVKRVHGMRLMGPAWKHSRAPATAPAVLTPRNGSPQ